jgi:hypothetical protein
MKNYKNEIVANIFFILFIGLFNGCDTTEPTNGVELDLNKNIFFPLNVGNKWYYNSYHINDPNFDSTKFDRSWEVISSKTLSNKIFYQIESIAYNNDSTIYRVDSIYYAIREDSLFLIDQGQPFIETSIQLRGLFNSDQYEHFIVQPDSDGNYLGYLINKTDSTNSFYYYRDGWNDSGWQMTFKKKVGYIESHSDWGLGSKLVNYILK